MKNALEENRQRPVIVDIVLHDGSPQGVRSARVSGTTCRVTYAPTGRASDIAQLVPSVDNAGILITWQERAERPYAAAVHDVRAVLACTKTDVAVVTTEHELLPPGVYVALGCALRGEVPERSRHRYDAMGIELAETARLLLATLQVPGFM